MKNQNDLWLKPGKKNTIVHIPNFGRNVRSRYICVLATTRLPAGHICGSCEFDDYIREKLINQMNACYTCRIWQYKKTRQTDIRCTDHKAWLSTNSWTKSSNLPVIKNPRCQTHNKKQSDTTNDSADADLRSWKLSVNSIHGGLITRRPFLLENRMVTWFSHYIATKLI